MFAATIAQVFADKMASHSSLVVDTYSTAVCPIHSRAPTNTQFTAHSNACVNLSGGQPTKPSERRIDSVSGAHLPSQSSDATDIQHTMHNVRVWV